MLVRALHSQIVRKSSIKNIIMGGEGSMSSAITSLRNNRSLLKKRKFKTAKDLLIHKSGKTKLEFKKVSQEELQMIKNQIRNETKRRNDKKSIIFVILFISSVLLFSISMIRTSKNTLKLS